MLCFILLKLPLDIMRYIEKIILLFLLWSFSIQSGAQNSTGINNQNPSAKAALDVQATSGFKQGILVPRLTAADTTSLKTGIPVHSKGLLFYDTTNAKYWYWTGMKWQGIGGMTATVGNNGSPFSQIRYMDITRDPVGRMPGNTAAAITITLPEGCIPIGIKLPPTVDNLSYGTSPPNESAIVHGYEQYGDTNGEQVVRIWVLNGNANNYDPMEATVRIWMLCE